MKNKAVADIEASRFKEGAMKLHQRYMLDKKDTIIARLGSKRL